MWYEGLAQELLSIRDGGARQVLVLYAREYAQGKPLALIELYRSHEACSPTALAEELGLSSGRVANILKALQQSGYVHRERDSADGRRVRIVLTERGAERARELYEAQVDTCGKMLCDLGEQDARELVRILKKIPTLHI